VSRFKVLITGNKGFIGSKVENKLKMSSDFQIYGLDIKNGKDEDIEKASVANRFFEKGLDYIFHFGSPCSVLQFGEENLVSSVQTSFLGFQNVLNLAKVSGAKLIYPSSGNVYGRKSLPHSEHFKPLPNNIYGECKFIEEIMAKNTDKVVSCGLRIFTGYGPGEEKKGKYSSVVCQFMQDIMKNRAPVIWGDGLQTRDCIFIDDIVDACIKAMKTKYSTVVNVGTGLGYNYNQIIEKINIVLNKEIKPVYIDKPVSNYVDKAVADTTWMKHFLGLKPISLEKGLEEMYNYLQINC